MPALAISVALHVAMLWPDALPRMALQAGQPLTATLRASRVAEPPASPAAINPETKAAPGRSAANGGPLPDRLSPATEGASTPGASAPAIAGSTAAAFSGGTGNAAAPPGDSPSLDADGVRAYRIVLAREAKAHRRYPALARERGWTGTAEVSVDVSREGRARHILLARSSGHDVLDREAVNMMSRAAASAALPDSLRGREFAVRLPVVFDFSEIQ